MNRILTLALVAGFPVAATAQTPPPLWAVLPDYTTANSCTLLAARGTSDGETADDTFVWQARGPAELQVGFGFTAQEAKSMQLPEPGRSVAINISIYDGRNGKAAAHDQAFEMTLAEEGQHVVSGVLPIDVLTLLKNGTRLMVQYDGRTIHVLNLKGSAQSIRDMGPCIADIGKKLEHSH